MSQFNPADMQATTDAIIRRGRATVSPNVVNMRQRPRFNIEELNSADIDRLRDEYLSDAYDDRSPITKAIDLVDLPRNSVLNIAAGRPTASGVLGATGVAAAIGGVIGGIGGSLVAPGPGTLAGAAYGAAGAAGLYGAFAGTAGLARAAGASDALGDEFLDSLPKAAAGQPAIMGSDLLRAMGVENRVIRGLGGFGLDIALDPLTYAGPAGFVTNTGRVALRKGAGAVVKGGLKEAAVDGAAIVRNPELKAMLRAGGVADNAAGKTYDDLARLWYGDAADGKVSKTFSYLGGDSTFKGGLLDKLLYTPLEDGMDPLLREGVEAAHRFVDKFGRGTRGFRIGEGGSEVAHIPFTDIAISVPGFTPTGKATLRQIRLAKDMANAAPMTPAMVHASQALADSRTILDGINDKRALFADSFAAGPPDPAAVAKYREDMREAAKAALEKQAAIKDYVANLSVAEDANHSTILKMAELRSEAAAIADMLMAESRKSDLISTTRMAVNSDLNARVKMQSETLARLQNYRGALARGADGTALITPDPAIQAESFEKSRAVMDQLDDAQKVLTALKKSPAGIKHPDYNAAAALVKKLRTDLIVESAPLRNQSKAAALKIEEARSTFSHIPENLFNVYTQAILEPIVKSYAQRAGITVDEAWEALRFENVGAGALPPGVMYQPVKHGSGALIGIDETGKVYNDKAFSTRFIGMGEGSQYKGWGLYFAQHDKVAQHYRNVGTYNRLLADGQMISRTDLEKEINSFYASVPGVRPDKLDKYANEMIEDILVGDIVNASDSLRAISGRHPELSSRVEDLIEKLRGVEPSPESTGWALRPTGGIRAERALTSDERRVLAMVRAGWNSHLEKSNDAALALEEAIVAAESLAEAIAKNNSSEAVNVRELATRLDLKPVHEVQPGAIYSADIDVTDANLLNLDAKLSAQHENVQRAVRELFDELPGNDIWEPRVANGQPNWRKWYTTPIGRILIGDVVQVGDGQFVSRDLLNPYFNPDADAVPEIFPTLDEALEHSDEMAEGILADALYEAKGERVYATLSDTLTQKHGYYQNTKTELGGKINMGLGGNDKAASEALLAKGIKGNKFLDNFSRHGKPKDPTYNFVVFDDNDVTITEALRQANRGAFWMDRNGQRVIAALKNPDLTTLIHESGHLIRSMLTSQELAAVSKAYGIPVSRWGATLDAPFKTGTRRTFEEMFADDLIRYFATGQLPASVQSNSTLIREAFDKIKNYLIELYKAVKGTPIEQQIHPAIKKIFDDFLAPGMGPSNLQTEDAFRQTLRDRHVSNLNDDVRKLWEDGEADPEGVEAYARSASAAAEAAKKYYDVIGGTLNMHRSPELSSLTEIVKAALGTSDDIVAHSLLGSVRSATSDLFGGKARSLHERLSKIDDGFRKKFGARAGLAAQHLAHIRAAMTTDPAVTASNVMADLLVSLRQASRDANVPLGMEDDLGPLLHMFVYQAAAEKSDKSWDTVFHLKKVQGGKLVDGEMVTALRNIEQRLRDNGVDFDKLRNSLKAIAAQQIADIDKYGSDEVADYLLDFLSPNYVPLAMTQRARAGMDVKAATAVFQNEAKAIGPGGAPTEGFQRARTTDIYQYTDPVTGEAKEFLGKDLWVLGMGEDELRRLAAESPDAYKRAMSVRDMVDQYHRLPNPPPPRPADPWRLNEMARTGGFAPISVGEDVDFFETSWPTVMGRRTAMHQRATARKQLVSFIRDTGLNVPRSVLDKLGQVGSREVTLPSGEKIVVGGVANSDATITTRVLARGRAFRYLDDKALAFNDNPVLAGITDGIKDILLPEELADVVEDHIRVLKDENLGPLLDAIEKATGVFRQLSLFHPSWTISNVIGNLANAAAGDIPVTKLMSRLALATKVRLARHDPAKLAKLSAEFAGRKYSGKELLDILDGSRAFRDHQPHVELAVLSRAGHIKLPSEVRHLPIGEGLKADARSAAELWANGDKMQAAGRMAGLPWNRLQRHVFRPWFEANGVIEDAFRGAALMARLDVGDDMLSAQRHMQRALFNYSDMTQFEQKYMRNVFPFYAWMRNNLAYQMETLFRRPAYAAAVPKTQHAIEEMIAGDDRVPPQLRPQWMRSALAMQIGKDPTGRFAAVLGQTIPQAEIFNLLQGLVGVEGAMDLGKSFLSQGNAVGLVAPQLASGTEFYSQRSIGPDEYSGDISSGEFLTGLVRPLAEYGPGGKVGRAFEQGGAQGAARAVLGGRVQAFDEDRITSSKLRELKDKETGIRRAIQRQERRGNDSLAARAELMRLYTHMEELGFGDEVPDWAKSQRLELAE